MVVYIESEFIYMIMPMTVLIKDEEADRLIRQLAERTGETITAAVKKAVSERLAKTPFSEDEIAQRMTRLRSIVAKFDAIPTIDDRSADEILGYNSKGHFD
jgi:antitoxin VapB